MKRYYERIKVVHMKRLARAEKEKCEPYTLSDFEGDDYDSEAGPPLCERAQPTTQNRRAIDSDGEDVVEIAPPKKRARCIGKTPKARKTRKGNVHRLQKKEFVVLHDEDEDEEMEDEIVTSDNDDESWAPNMKEHKKNKTREKSRRAAAKPRTTMCRVRNQIPNVPKIDPKRKPPISETNKSTEKKLELKKSFFEQTVENAARSEKKSKGLRDKAQMSARQALRRLFYAFPQSHQELNLPAVDQTDLYPDSTD